VVPGQTAIVRPLLGGEEPATVAFTPAVTDPGAATGEVRLTLQNPVSLPIDTPVSVEILLDVRTDVLVVPTAAVQRDDLGAYVMIAGDDGLAHRREVRAGLVAGELAQIVTGLEADESVIVSGVTDESEGLPIVIVP
jgi:membrane fusion protein (multidrug efflux system)